MFSFGMFSSRTFKVELSSFSVAMLPGNLREDVDRGGKIILPPSSLDMLYRLNVSYPMLFRISNGKMSRVSHCGVLEFVAEEGKAYLPNWMMRNLMLEEGDPVQLENTELPVATFSRFQPQSVDFLDIHNPKAVLENSLRQYACLTTGDLINIRYNDRDYELSVLETRPGEAVTIIECDMNVDFAPPLGYREPSGVADPEAEPQADPTAFSPFAGAGQRLDGKVMRQTESEVGRPRQNVTKRGVPDYDWRVGTLNFMRTSRQSQTQDPGETRDSFQAFGGKGSTLRKVE